jgi:hypothetical protein
VFYLKDWHNIGTKDQLCDLVATITGINLETLQGQDLELVSVAKKMSWAAQRMTSRVEDIVYCLLGIFDVNMLLLYREGKKAFLRLEEEILKGSCDQLLFAWGMPPAISQMKSFIQVRKDYDDQVGSQKEPSSKYSHPNGKALERPLLQGLLADCPAEFANSRSIVPLLQGCVGDSPPTVTNQGVRIELCFICGFSLSGDSMYGFSLPELTHMNGGLAFGTLSCRIEDKYFYTLGLTLRPLDYDSFGQLAEPVLVPINYYGPRFAQKFTKAIHIKPEKLIVSSFGQVLDRKGAASLYDS